MKVLAIDFGTKYLGLALADMRVNIAFPYKTLKNKGLSILDEIEEIIKKEKVKKIVIGLPIGMSGKKTEQTKITDKFINFLKGNLLIPVEIFDERLSTKMVKSTINYKFRYKYINYEFGHAAAAAIILQNYLDLITKR